MQKLIAAVFLLFSSQAWAQACPLNQTAATDEPAIAAASAAAQKSLATTLGKKQTGQFTVCLRANAQEQLLAIDRLATQSSLYEVSVNTIGEEWFDLGASAVTQDFLARQLARTSVLLGYAQPYVTLLQNTDGSNDARRPNVANSAYWSNSITELNRYVQFTDANGQVSSIEKLITSLAQVKKSDCKSWLSAYQSANFGNDLFSMTRQKLETIAKLSCK